MKRFLDIFLSALGLLVFFPFAFIIAICIKLDSKGPVFFRQWRVGRYGNDFRMFKFRTMSAGSDKAGLLTIGNNDRRITRAGTFLRKYKLDELPQLLNVFLGHMSIVGPRPEVRRYVDCYTEEQKKVLLVKPGITDLASIEYSNENEILANSDNPEETYLRQIMPEKIMLNMIYISDPSVRNYLRITMKTIRKLIFHSTIKTNHATG